MFTPFTVKAFVVFLNFRFVDWSLVANVGCIKWCFAQCDLEHRLNSGELKMVKTFFKWLVLVVNSDVGDYVYLMKTRDALLDKLSKLNY